MIKTLTILAVLWTSFGALRAQTVPAGVSYQGRLTDATGVSLPDGIGYEVEVRLWTISTGGTLVWGARYGNVSVKAGAFNLILGASGGQNLPGAQTTDLKQAFNAPDRYLGLTITRNGSGAAISGLTEILPRQQILATPYAFQSETARTVSPLGITTNMLGDASVTASKLSPDAATPAGAIAAFVGNNAPSGWLMCDGSEVSKTTYPRLAIALSGNQFGSAADAVNNLKLPDLRGYFLRGVDGSAGRDPDKSGRTAIAPGGATGNVVGSVQDEAFKSHAHMTDGSGQGNQHAVRIGSDANIDYYSGHARADDADYGTGSKTGISGASETRPKNVYVNYIIKY